MTTEEVEKQVLGSYCSAPDLFQDVEHLVSEHLFSSTINRTIYGIIKRNHSNSIHTDFTLLFNSLSKLGYNKTQISGALKGLNSDSNTLHSPIPKVLILFEELIKRSLSPLLIESAENLNSTGADVLETLAKLRNKITDIDAVMNNVSKEVPITKLFDDALNRIISLKNDNKQLVGYTFGIKALDEKTGGIMPGFNVIAGRPGMGKTSLIVTILIENAIKGNVPTVFFSLEMNSIEIMTNIIANNSEINSFVLRNGFAEDSHIESIKSSRGMFKENLLIDDTPGISYKYFEAKIRKMRKKTPLNIPILAIIDYFQLMADDFNDTKGKNDETILNNRCKELNNIAKKYNVALVVLSQLSRDLEKRTTGPRPKMSDLYGTGGLEATGQLVLLLYRPDYYQKNPTDDKGNDLNGVCEIGLGKARYASPKPVYSRFIGKYSRFTDYEEPKGISSRSDDAF